MAKSRVIATVTALIVGLSAWLYAAPNLVTREGKLVSASCYLEDHSLTGDEMGGRPCGSGCLKQGKPGGLLTKDNQFFILDGPSLALAPYVGQEIRVTGEERAKDILSVYRAEVKRAGGWESIDTRYHPTK